jgi:hypothetical protein
MASCAMTGERGVMVAMAHGLCVCFFVCGETTKNKVGPKKGECDLVFKAHLGLAIGRVMLVVLLLNSSISILVLCCSCFSFIASNRNVNKFIRNSL